MLLGVVSFSFANGTMASVVSNLDKQNANFEEKQVILTSMIKEYQLPFKLHT